MGLFDGGSTEVETKTPLDWIAKSAKKIYKTTALPDPYAGDYLAPTSEYTQKGLDAGSSVPELFTGAADDYINTLKRYASGEFRDVSKDQTLQSAITAAQTPTIRAFNESILPQIQSGATMQGAWGGERADIGTSQAARDLESELMRVGMEYAYPAAVRQEDIQLRTPELLSAAANAASIPANLYTALGKQDEAISQRSIDEAIAKYNASLQMPYRGLTAPAQLLSGLSFGSQTTQGQSTDWMSQLMPILGALGSAGIAAASDIRVKRDIKLIGKWKQYPIYLFRYIWSDLWQIGVMAQEVRRIKPQAVSSVGGMLVVDYGRL